MNSTYNFNEARSLASVAGLRMGLLWLCIFLCYVKQADYPLLSFLMLFLSVYSLFVGANMIHQHRRLLQGARFAYNLYFAWTFFTFSALLCTFGEYLYFQFIDGGRFFQAISTLLQDPAYGDILQGQFNMDQEMLLTKVATITIRDLVMSFFIFNTFFAGASGILCLVLEKIIYRQKSAHQ